jgi:hypothetical protein
MVDYNAALPQLTPYQAPNVLGMAEMANKLQLYNTMRQEKERGFAESNALRDWIKNGGDVTTPEGQRAAVALAPNAGPGFIKANLDIIGQDRANKQAALGLAETQGRINAQGPALQTSQTEAAAKTLAFHRDTAPMVKDQATYDIWRANVTKDSKELGARIDPIYTPENMQRYMMTANQSLEQLKQATEGIIKEIDLPGGRKGFVRITSKGVETLPQIGAPGAATPTQPFVAPNAAAPTQPFAAPANAPAAIMRQPIATNVPAAAAPAVGDTYAQRNAQIEGTDKNPMSSAQGLHQFINGTFVDTVKKVFPELANKSPAEILTLRGTKLADGTPIESALEQRFRTDNIASLASAGIQPTPGNTYLAHFLGAGGARSVLGADPNTPVTSLLDPRAIAANKSVLEGKTAGEVAAWAANKFGNQPGLAASMTAGNARLGGAPAGFVPAGGVPMSLGAPTVNNALMANMFGAAPPQNAMLSLQPQIPGAATQPTTQTPATAAAAAPTPATKPPVLAEISPAEAEKRDASQATAIRQYVAAQQALDEQIKNVQELKTHKGLSSITGSIAGHPYMPNITQDAANAQELLTSITEKGKLEELLNLKAMGGSLGQVAVSEGEGLKKAHGVLGQRQDTETFRGRVGQLESKLTAAKSALKDAFEQQYAYRGIPAPDVPAMPTVEMPKAAAPADAGVARNERGRRGALNAVPNRPPLTFFGGG